MVRDRMTKKQSEKLSSNEMHCSKLTGRSPRSLSQRLRSTIARSLDQMWKDAGKLGSGRVGDKTRPDVVCEI